MSLNCIQPVLFRARCAPQKEQGRQLSFGIHSSRPRQDTVQFRGLNSLEGATDNKSLAISILIAKTIENLAPILKAANKNKPAQEQLSSKQMAVYIWAIGQAIQLQLRIGHCSDPQKEIHPPVTIDSAFLSNNLFTEVGSFLDSKLSTDLPANSTGSHSTSIKCKTRFQALFPELSQFAIRNGQVIYQYHPDDNPEIIFELPKPLKKVLSQGYTQPRIPYSPKNWQFGKSALENIYNG